MAVIEIHLKALQQLYDSLDPSPFQEKALDRHAEEYLIDSVGEFGERDGTGGSSTSSAPTITR